MRYDFLIETYETERIKVISVWSMFADEDLPVRPHPTDTRGRSVHEHMVHQCVSEDSWFRTMLDVHVGAPPLPKDESRLGFMRKYADDSGKRLTVLREKEETWWEGETTFFDVSRSRAWVLTRRIAHTAHHRGQQLALLRMLGRDAHSNYGPTADTGGLMQITHLQSMLTQAWRLSLKGKPPEATRRICRVAVASRSRSGRTNNGS